MGIRETIGKRVGNPPVPDKLAETKSVTKPQPSSKFHTTWQGKVKR